jgi:hypothetical protein
MTASTTQSPYLVSTNCKVIFESILNVGDIVGTKNDETPCTIVSIPDGLGAHDNGDSTMTVLMNHELSATFGSIRDNGSAGAFVSKLVVDKATLEVRSADDLIQKVHLYSSASGLYEEKTTAFARFCPAERGMNKSDTTAPHKPVNPCFLWPQAKSFKDTPVIIATATGQHSAPAALKLQPPFCQRTQKHPHPRLALRRQ